MREVSRRRRAFDRAFRSSTLLAAGSAAALLVAIAGFVLWRGAGALEPALLIDASGDELGSGGLRYQLLGSLVLVATALISVTPLATGMALLSSVYSSGAIRRALRFVLLTLNGVPSIVLGILGLALFGQLLGWGKSWLAGGWILGFMILPTVTLALIERIEALPKKYYESASALGLSRGQIVRAVVLPQSATGLVSGLFLGLARAFGETAPILFTAVVFSGVTLPGGVRDSPVLALPYHIFVLAQDSFNPRAATHLWAAASVLLALVLLLNLLSLHLRSRMNQEASRG